MRPMTIPEPSFTIGIEEEYLLVDRETRDLENEPPQELLAVCEACHEGQVVGPEHVWVKSAGVPKVGRARNKWSDKPKPEPVGV